MAEAIAEREKENAKRRQGQRTDLEHSGNISLMSEAGQSRDAVAQKVGLGSGKTLEAAQKVVERDENDQRKDPTISEKVALAEAIAETLAGRQLANLKQNREGNISHSDETGRTKDIAAAKAGLGSGNQRVGFSIDVQGPASTDYFPLHFARGCRTFRTYARHHLRV